MLRANIVGSTIVQAICMLHVKIKKVAMVNSNKISEIKIILEGLMKDLDSLSRTEMVSPLKWEDLFTNLDTAKQKINSLKTEQERAFMREQEREIATLNSVVVELKRIVASAGVNILDVEQRDISVAAIENVSDSEEEFEIELIEEDGDIDLSQPEWMLDEPGPRVYDLNDAITLNDKLFFINELYNGDAEQYYLCIQRLNEFTYFREALEYVRHAFTDWNEDSPEVYRFYMILRRRYEG